MYIILLFGVVQAAVLHKIIYGWEEMNQMKEVLGEGRGLKDYYLQLQLRIHNNWIKKRNQWCRPEYLLRSTISALED